MKLSVFLPKPERSYEQFRLELATARASGALVLHVETGPRPLMPKEVDRLLNLPQLGQLYAGTLAGQDVHLAIDLQHCSFLDPFASTVLHSLVAAVSGHARIWLCLPELANVRAYCGVSGLIEALREHVTLVGEVHLQRPSEDSEVLVPLRVFSQLEDVEAIVAASIEKLENLLERLDWPKAITRSAAGAIKEATMNVIEHADASGSFTLQAYKLRTPDPYVIVALSDAGVGVRATLERKYPTLPSSDAHLLQTLLDDRLTSREDRQRGLGMRELRSAVREVRGRLDLRSGAGLYCESERRTWRASRAYIPGTHLRLALNGPPTG